jgi:hypothetical protein
MTMVAPYTQGALAGFGRRRKAMMRAYPRRGFGQDSTPWYAGIVNAIENVAGGLPANAPIAGGGWASNGSVNADGSTTINYTDSNGQQGIMTVPANADGSPATPDQLTAAVAATGAGTTPPIVPPALQIPSWAWWVIGGVVVMALLGYSGVGKLIPQSRPAAATNYRRRHNRRRSRSRR